MAAPGLVLIKTFSYRDAAEEWSNDYHFQGDAPDTPADWRSLVDDLVDLEKNVLTTSVSIVRAICYEDTNDDSVYTYDLTAFSGAVQGTIAIPDGKEAMPGDVAYCARWDTGRRTSTNKPIYLRKYWHGALQNGTDPDLVYATMLSNVATFALAVMSPSDSWPGLAGPDGAAPVGYRAMPDLTTRTLKRRGRRPT